MIGLARVGQPMLAVLQTAVCDLMGCDHPVVLAGMGGVSRADLVAAVCEAGGYGFLGMVREPPGFIRSQIRAVRSRTKREFGVNLIPAATPPALLEEQVSVCLAERVAAVCLFWDVTPALIRRFREAGTIVVLQVGSASEAKQAVSAGAQAIIVQGVGAGGHVRGRADWRTLLPEIVEGCDVPVLAAGGIVDGAGLAEAISLGADGVVIGTGFVATVESFAHSYHKQRIVESREGDTVHTDAFHINWPAGAPVRVLANSVTRGEWGHPYQEPSVEIGTDDGRPIVVFSTDSPLRTTTGEIEAMAIYAGEGAARIDRVMSAGERVATIVEQASALLGVAPPPASDDLNPNVSPVCFAEDAGDVYMGYAPREEVLSALHSLLETKRGEARAAIRLATSLKGKSGRTLMSRIYRHGADACQSLVEAIILLGGTPSRRMDGIADRIAGATTLSEELSFIQGAQHKAAEEARQLLPRVRNDRLYEVLTELVRCPIMTKADIVDLSGAESHRPADPPHEFCSGS